MPPLQVKHAHYFQQAENGDIYLIVLDGDEKKTKYFAITEVEGSGMTEKIRKVRSVAGPPGEIRVMNMEGRGRTLPTGLPTTDAENMWPRVPSPG